MLDEFDHGVFGDPYSLIPDETGLVALGGRLTPETVSEAYSKGIFPWSGLDPIPWFSPDPRLILLPKNLHRSRTLKKLLRQNKFQIRFDDDFSSVLSACADIDRNKQDGTWINGRIPKVYTKLHERGIVHCVSVYEQEHLVGGLYGLTFGRVFFGESMFSRVSNASKVALSALCDYLVEADFEMIDCQQETDHLQSLGAITVSRSDFMHRLKRGFQYPSLHRPWHFSQQAT
jgi:leucyl/phenylalanyl-tRNA---protein transferase